VESGQFTLSGAVSGTGGLTVIRAGELRLTSVSSYLGNTVVSNGGTFTLREQGSIVNSPNVSVLGGTLNLDSLAEGGRSDFNSNTRLRSNANVTLNAAIFTLKGNDIVDTNQVIGPINLVGGASRIVSTPGGGPRVATLTASRLNRNRGATVSF